MGGGGRLELRTLNGIAKIRRMKKKERDLSKILFREQKSVLITQKEDKTKLSLDKKIIGVRKSNNNYTKIVFSIDNVFLIFTIVSLMV